MPIKIPIQDKEELQDFYLGTSRAIYKTQYESLLSSKQLATIKMNELVNAANFIFTCLTRAMDKGEVELHKVIHIVDKTRLSELQFSGYKLYEEEYKVRNSLASVTSDEGEE